MAARREHNPFTPLQSGADYAIEWETVDEADEDAPVMARDALGLTAQDRAALGLSPAGRRPAESVTGAEDARGMLARLLRS